MKRVTRTKELLPAPEDAVLYYITSNVMEIEADENGTPVAPTQSITLTQWKKEGSNAAVQSSERKMRVWKVKDGVQTRLFYPFQGVSCSFAASEVSGSHSVLAELMNGSDIVASLSVPLKWRGKEGSGYKAVVHRDSFTESQWNTYCAIGNTESWNNTSDSRNGCRTGDLFNVVGYATDTGNYHDATFRCDNDSGNLHGVCISHQITQNGADAVTHEIRISPYVVTRNGNTLSPSSVTISVYRKVGNANPVPFTGYLIINSNTGSVIHAGSHSTYGVNVNTSMAFPLKIRMWASSDDTDDTPLAENSIHMVSDGEAGDTQLMYYPAGVFSIHKTYTRDGNSCPVVLHEGYYYYLKEPTNRVNGTAYPPTNSDYWELAKQFVLGIVEALFAAFAKLGSFVVSGDFFISQYGTLYEGSTEITIGYSNYSSTWNGKVPYAYFDGSDPMVDTMPTSGSYKFRPTLVLNARTGDTYQNNAFVMGVVRTKAIYTVTGGFETIDGKLTIDLDGNPGNSYVLPANTTVYLPDPTNYEGLTITILFSNNSILVSTVEIKMAYYTSSSLTSATANSMGPQFIHATDGLSLLTLQAINAYAGSNRVNWVVTGQRGILFLRHSPGGADVYTILPDGRIIE